MEVTEADEVRLVVAPNMAKGAVDPMDKIAAESAIEKGNKNKQPYQPNPNPPKTNQTMTRGEFNPSS